MEDDGSETQLLDQLSDDEGKLFDLGNIDGQEMEVGRTYILREVAAPTGYGRMTADVLMVRHSNNKVSIAVRYTAADGSQKTIDLVDENGEVVTKEYVDAGNNKVSVKADGTVLIEDDHIHFIVNKVDAGNGEEVEGAKIVVIDKETGKEVDSWTSKKGETHDFGDKLEAGKTYILRETVAPEGYDKITTDIEVKVSEEGVVTTELKATTDKDGNTVYLVEDNAVKKAETKTTTTSKAVRTGDFSQPMFWLLLMAAALLSAVAVILRRRHAEHK